MSDEQDIDLPEDVRALLEQAREQEVPVVGASDRVWARLEESLDLPALQALEDAGSDDANGAPEPSTESVIDGASTTSAVDLAGGVASATNSSFVISKMAAGVWTAATFALGAITGAGTHAVISEREPPVLSRDAAPSHAAEAMTTREPSAPEPPASEDSSIALGVNADMASDMGRDTAVDATLDMIDSAKPDLERDARAPARERPEKVGEDKSSSKTRAASLRAERVLLTRAQRELEAGDTEAALATLQEHEENFEKPQLAEEREALRIRALLSAGDHAKARARFERFSKRYPRSIFLDALSPAFEPR